MKVLMLLVADHASVEPTTGKLNVLGAFRQIYAPVFPVQHRTMSLIIKLGGEIGDKPNPHDLAVSLTDVDGNELLQVNGSFDMPRGEPGIQPEFNAVMEFRDIVFSHPGMYSFVIRVDDDDDITDQTGIQVVQRSGTPQG